MRFRLDAARAVVFDVAPGVAARLAAEQVVEEVAARARARSSAERATGPSAGLVCTGTQIMVMRRGLGELKYAMAASNSIGTSRTTTFKE